MSAAGLLNNQTITDKARTMVKEPHEDIPSPAITPGAMGRIKAPPSSALEGLSGSELSKFCFSPDQAKNSSAAAERLVPPLSLSPVHVSRDSPLTAPSSIGNSAHKNEMAPPFPVAVVKDVPAAAATGETTPSGSSATTTSASSVINARVLKRTTSRQGREKQRWERGAKENHLYRLTTGAVPIMQDGKILLVSSSRKAAWILPKGGWDNDESLEESAIREVYEEGGVIGSLGPKLTDIIYETRKAKKRRLEREEMLQQHRREKSETETSKSNDSAQSGSEDHPNQKPSSSTPDKMNSVALLNDPLSLVSNSAAPQAQRDEGSIATNNTKPAVSNADATVAGVAARIRASLDADRSVETAESTGSTSAAFWFDDTASVASAASGTSDGTSPNTHVKLSLFVLYVTEALNEWPESGRSRKVVDIDEAIATMESQSRPEFRAALMEVKQRGLHNVTSGKEATEEEKVTTERGTETASEDKKI